MDTYIWDGSYWTQLHYEVSINITYQVDESWLGIAVSPINENDVCFGTTRVFRNTDVSDPNSFFVDISAYNIHPDARNYQPPIMVTSDPLYCDNIDDALIHPDIHSLVYEPVVTNPKLFASHHGGISYIDYNSMDHCDWKSISTGLSVATTWTGDNSNLNNDYYIMGCQDNGVYLFDNNWYNFTGGDGYGAQIGYDSDENIEIVSFIKQNYNFFRIQHIPSGWDEFSENITRPKDPLSVNSFNQVCNTFKIVNDPATTNPIFTMNELWSRLSSDQTALPLWRLESDIYKTVPVQWKRQVTELAISKSDPNYVYAAIGGVDNFPIEQWDNEPKLFRSSNGFSNDDNSMQYFEDITNKLTPLPAGSSNVYPIITGIAVSPTNPNDVWVSFTGYLEDFKVWKYDESIDRFINDDPTQTLFNLPVNSIVYQEGTNDRLYIGTDVGVYYKDNSTNGWIKMKGIPNVRVTELIINPCSGKLIAYTFGRGIWECSLLPENKSDEVVELEIIQNTTWSTEQALNSNIRIKDGSTLTLTASLYMGANRKIIVEPGATLFVDGGTITNQCGAFWQGIEVLGYDEKSQLEPGAQGQVILKNATIENARVGVITVANSEDLEHNDFTSTGGIVKAEDSYFTNCQTGVHFLPYTNRHPSNSSLELPNLSYIKNCTFSTTDNLANGESPMAFIKMYEVDWVKILGNTFMNSYSKTPWLQQVLIGTFAH